VVAGAGPDQGRWSLCCNRGRASAAKDSPRGGGHDRDGDNPTPGDPVLQVRLVTNGRALLRALDRQRVIATHSLEFKAKVVLEATSGRKTIQDRSGGCR